MTFEVGDHVQFKRRNGDVLPTVGKIIGVGTMFGERHYIVKWDTYTLNDVVPPRMLVKTENDAQGA